MDYLRECMSDVGNPPIDDMNRNFCVVCSNRGCERAGAHQSAFDKRVKNWRETLFLKVPRAADDDRSYDNIRAKNFAPIGAPEPPKTSVFMPGAPAAGPATMARPAAFVPPPPPQDPGPQPAAAPDVTPEAPQPAPAPAAVVKPRQPPPGNTPFEQGMVLGGGQTTAPPAQPRPEPDPEPSRQGRTFILEDED